MHLTSSFSDFSLPQLRKLFSIVTVLHKNAEVGQEQLGTCQQPCWPYCLGGSTFLSTVGLDYLVSLVPRPFPPPVFDRLKYAKTEGEGLGERVTCMMSG